MANEHRIPAAYLGLFGTGKGKLRERRLEVVGEKGSWSRKRADKINSAKSVFRIAPADSVEGFGPEAMESLWRFYEPNIPTVAQEFSRPQHHISHQMWVGGLIPLVAGMFARDMDYNFFSNHASHPTFNRERNRIIFFQEMSDAIMHSSWNIVAAIEGEFITSDRGYCTTRVSVIFPLTPKVAIELHPTPDSLALVTPATLGSIYAYGRSTATLEKVQELNQLIADSARSEIYARNKSALENVHCDWSKPPMLCQPDQILRRVEIAKKWYGNFWLRECSKSYQKLPPVLIPSIPPWAPEVWV